MVVVVVVVRRILELLNYPHTGSNLESSIQETGALPIRTRDLTNVAGLLLKMHRIGFRASQRLCNSS